MDSTYDENRKAWEPGEVSPRTKFCSYVTMRIKQGLMRDELEKEAPDWLKESNIELKPWVIAGIFDWGYRVVKPLYRAKWTVETGYLITAAYKAIDADYPLEEVVLTLKTMNNNFGNSFSDDDIVAMSNWALGLWGKSK